MCIIVVRCFDGEEIKIGESNRCYMETQLETKIVDTKKDDVCQCDKILKLKVLTQHDLILA